MRHLLQALWANRSEILAALPGEVLRLAARRLPVRYIDALDGTLYLTRYTVFGGEPTRPTMYLHRFAQNDTDRNLHSHPWWGLSLVLAGGYRETRRVWRDGAEGVEDRVVRAGRINLIAPHTYHRVDLLDRECWSLILTSPRMQEWGFWDRITGVVTPWRTYLGIEVES